MVTIEKCMKTTATEEDLKVFEDIEYGLKIFKRQYEYITWFNNALEFKEYTTLQQDFLTFFHALPYNNREYEVYILQSLHRSFIILYKKVLQVTPAQETLFKHFLSQCSLNIRNIINQVTEAN